MDIRQAAISCMKCGFCKAVCPVHVGAETTSPRARVRLARAFDAGEIDLSDALLAEIGHCINCKACVAECPSGVPVDRVVLEMRHQAVVRNGLHPAKRFIFRKLLADSGRLAAWARLLGGLNRISGIASPRNPLRTAFPLFGLPKDKRLPPLGRARPFRSIVPEVAEPVSALRLTVAYFVGCSGDLMYPDVALATWRVLRTLGCRVIVPREMVCCGTPVLNAGDFEGARTLAARNLEVLSRLDVDAIVTACGSCGLTIGHEWQGLLGLDVPEKFPSRIVDIAVLTQELLDRELEMPEEITVTYHDPCHLRRGMGVYREPRELFQSIAGLRYLEMPSADRCCGGGGAFSIYYPELSRTVGAEKAGSIASTGADAVVTGCPSCMMQLDESVQLAGMGTRVIHTAQILDLALR